MPDPSVGLMDKMILEQIDSGSRVVDLGCGDGRLLEQLRHQNGCSVQGVELDVEEIKRAITRGVPVIHADLDKGLVDVPDSAFDWAVLSQTLQQVARPQSLLLEMLRVARKALVVVPNFGYWRVRRQLLFRGRAPVTSALPYEWYNTPNRHFMSMYDFRDLVAESNIAIQREIPFIGDHPAENAWLTNLRAHNVLYVLERGN
ncbi:MAG: methionine biosynthesis protein MetW [Planctomycetaceae bacterium]|nr:methionine biosynthesis protein MetW [Planctomycetaceae bacterium]